MKTTASAAVPFPSAPAGAAAFRASAGGAAPSAKQPAVMPALVSALRELRLAGMAATLDLRLTEARERNLACGEFLELLLEDERSNREANGLKVRITRARLPAFKTLEDFDFAFQPDISKRLLFELATARFIRQKENVVFMGQPGTGKTHLAIAIAHKALLCGYKVLFTTVSDMMEALRAARADESFARARNTYIAPDLLVLDELGFHPLSQNTVHDFFEIIAKRYEQRSTVITSNKLFEEWSAVFPDQILATAIIDRLVHHCHPIVMKGESFRVKEHLCKKTAATFA